MTMSESKYYDVVMNLRNTGVNAMKSYYANTFNTSLEKHRVEHSGYHFKAAYDKYTHTLQSPPKARKFECPGPYQSLDSRKARCEPISHSEKYRLPMDSKINPAFPGYPVSSPTEQARVHDIHNVSAYTHKLTQYCRDKINYENSKRTYDNISSNNGDEFDIKHPRPHPAEQHARYRYTPFRNESNYHHNHPFYPPKSDIEKAYTNGLRESYEKYRSLPSCNLPCCTSFNYDAKSIESRSYYARRGESLSPTYSPSFPKKSDYASDQSQGLSSREPGESSAFSPIRPSHIRRVHSTESGYSSESNGTCHSSSGSFKEDSCKNPKCCAMLDLNSPTRAHSVCRDLGSQLNGVELAKQTNGDIRDPLPNERERAHLPDEHHLQYPNGQRTNEYEDLRGSKHEFKGPFSRPEYRERRMSGSRYHEAVWQEHVNNEKNHREMYNMEKIRRTHSADEDTRREINDENKRWNSVSDFNVFKDNRILSAKPNDNKLEVSDEASRAAMKAFDAHVRKMIARTRENPSENKEKLPTDEKHNNTDNKKESNEKKQSNIKNSIKHSISQLCGDEQSQGKNTVDDIKPENLTIDIGKNSLLELSKEEPTDSNENEKTSTNQNCDSTKEKGIDEVKQIKEEHDEKHDYEKNDLVKNEKDEIPSPQPELQCPAVDSTLNDEVASTPTTGGGLLGLARVANEQLGQALAKEKKRSKNNNCLHLWQFLRRMLDQEQDKVGRCIEWTNRETGEFRLIKTAVIADLWGQSKNRTCMTYEKMARAMRYYYKMNILEKVPHKRLHFRFGERILTKVLHPTNSKPFMGKTKIFDDMYNMNKRNMNTNYNTPAIIKPSANIVGDFRTGHNLKYLQLQNERSKNTIPYLPTDIPGVTLSTYYNEHSNNILHYTLPHLATSRINDIPPSRDHIIRKRTESNVLPCNIPRKIIPPPNSLNTTSPGSNPSVSPYSGGEETPETWSDIDSNDELVVDTDSE